jgi:hypothetical protein
MMRTFFTAVSPFSSKIEKLLQPTFPQIQLSGRRKQVYYNEPLIANMGKFSEPVLSRRVPGKGFGDGLHSRVRLALSRT